MAQLARSGVQHQATGASSQSAIRLLMAAAANPSASSSAAMMGSALLRGLSTSPRILTSNLLNVLGEEIKHEQESYAKPAEIVSGPPAPFTLQENGDGDTLLTLVGLLEKEAEGGDEEEWVTGTDTHGYTCCMIMWMLMRVGTAEGVTSGLIVHACLSMSIKQVKSPL